jgi:hypothetical protein
VNRAAADDRAAAGAGAKLGQGHPNRHNIHPFSTDRLDVDWPGTEWLAQCSSPAWQ